jgi:hypothetical protein
VLDGWMSKVKSNGRVEVPTAVLESARKDFLAERVSDEKARFSVYHTAQLLNEKIDVGSDSSLPRPHAILHR